MSPKQHICICICTYRRPDLLTRLLDKLEGQETENAFDYSIVIVDNDKNESARQVVERLARRSNVSIKYCVEPDQNIALARNKAIENAQGDYVAFIDDDEFPHNKWLSTLFKMLENSPVDGVLGPVIPYFDSNPPSWILEGKFFDRPMHPTGTILTWKFTRTGNALIRFEILKNIHPFFNPQLGSGGEDRDFFRRLIAKGHRFVWCNEAEVYEVVPPHRWNESFMLRRALLRGQGTLANPSYSKLGIIKSFIAIILYISYLPFLVFFGKHIKMRYLIKFSDHFGKVSAFFGFKLIKEKYITEK